MWEQIRQLRDLSPGVLWCILGDFNSIMRQEERVGLSQRGEIDSNMEDFNEWIEDLQVEDVPSVGRKFTWYKPNVTTKSRLDRFIVSAEWLRKWQGTTQFILERNFSDHCPVVLKSEVVDWGP